MDSNFVTLLIIVIPILEIVAFYFLIDFYNEYKVISSTETTKIKDLKKGIYEVKGRIVPSNEKIYSPLSEKPCVYFEFKVYDEDSGDDIGNRPIIDDSRYIKFGIDDGTGIAIIDLMNAKLDIKFDRKKNSGRINPKTPKMNRVFIKYFYITKGMLERPLKYDEVYLEEDAELYVQGEVKDFENDHPIFRSGDIPLLISDKTEDELLKQKKGYIIFTIVVSISLPLIEAFLLWKF